MIENVEKSKINVPYMPFKTFKSFVEKLNTTAVPPKIDSSILSNLSGSMRGSLISGLKSLGLIEKSGNVHDDLRNLVNSYNTEGWKAVLLEVISSAYSAVIGNVDIETGTIAQLNEAFRLRGNVDGQVREKSIRFYLAALKECDAASSPHFAERRTRKRATTKSKKSSVNKPSNDKISETPPGPGTITIPIAIPGKEPGQLIIPDELTQKQWGALKKICEFTIKTHIDTLFGIEAQTKGEDELE